MRILFAGSPPFAGPILEALLNPRVAASGHDVVGIVTQPGRPQGRGRKARDSEIAQVASSRGILWTAPENVNDDNSVEWCARQAPDVFVVASFGQILKDRLLTFAPAGALNIHASVLPRHRGASPIAEAIRQGDFETGVSIQRMVRKLDAGPICAVARTPIGPRETAGDLTQRLARLGGELLLSTLDRCAAGTLAFEEQDPAFVTFAPKLTKESGRIDWTKPAREIERLVRAMNPWPGAFTHLIPASQLATDTPASTAPLSVKGVLIRIFRAEVDETLASGRAPGSILGLPADRGASPPRSLGVATSEGCLVILELQPEGGKVMGGADFLRGQRLIQGTCLQS